MNKRLVFGLLGKILLVEAALMALPLCVSLIYRGGDAMSFVWSILLCLAVGFPLSLIKPRNEAVRSREGFVAVALCWVVLSAFGAMPFFLGGYVRSYVDCFFEMVSGFTTTGSTILADVEALPKGILFWRSFSHWIGGMGILVFSLAVLPKMGGRTLNLLKAESPGPTPGKIVPRIGNTAKILYLIYLAMTVAMVVVMLICGMDVFDALINTFGAAGTGGFSNYNASVGHFNSAAIDIWTGTFMMLFGVNFSLYFYVLQKNFKQVLKNEELRWFLSIVALSTVLIALNILPNHKNFWDAMRYSYFQVTTIISTTGYATENFNLWPQFSKTILILLMFVGACAGSTGGGLKVIRLTLLSKSGWREFLRTISPRGVQLVKLEGRAVEESVLGQVLVFAFLYLIIILFGTLLVSLDGHDFETTFTAVIAAVSNIGPGMSMVGPAGNFSFFSDFSKIVLSACMLLGRLEIYPMLMLFTASAWRKN